jgi:glucose-specific phosphotransferase system IIA component
LIIHYRQPILGKHLNITSSNDDTFGKLLMGNGFLIIPNDDTCYSPVTGKIILIHPSNHFIVIKDLSGIHVLIHIGFGTVDLNGEGFHLLKKLNDDVKTGEVLLTFDKNFLEKNSISLNTPVVFIQKQNLRIINEYVKDQFIYMTLEVT